MSAKPKSDGNQRRTDEVLLRMLTTPPQPRPKKKAKQPKKAAKK